MNSKVTSPPIPFYEPYVHDGATNDFEKVLRQGVFKGNGPVQQRCVDALQALTSAEHIMMTSSCTHALEIAIIALNLRPGDEVLIPSYTFVSVANAVLLHGGTPVFIDIDPHACALDWNIATDAVSPRTKALILMHYSGMYPDAGAISNFKNKHPEIAVIEDAAHSLGSFANGHHLGTLGDFGCFSFHETKNIHCGEGGALLVNNPKYRAICDIIQEKGTNRKAFANGDVSYYTWVSKGSSFLMNEFTASFLEGQLGMVSGVTQRRLQIASMYHKVYTELNIECTPVGTNGYNGHLFYILCADEDQRNAFIQFLKTRGTDTRFHYVPLHTSPMGKQFAYHYAGVDFSTQLGKRLVRLPLYYSMTDQQVQTVIEQVTQFFAK